MTKVVAEVNLYILGLNRADANIGGWGCLLSAGGKQKPLYGGHFGEGSGDNVKSDMMALHALQAGLCALSMPATIRVYTSSKYVIDICSKWIEQWRASNWKTKAGEGVPNQDLLKSISDQLLKHKVSFVEGANEEEGLFVEAATLANQGIDERLDEARSAGTAGGSQATQKQEGLPTPPVVQQGGPVAARAPSDEHPIVAANQSEIDALKALLRECLPVLCCGLSLDFLKKSDPSSLAVRVAVAAE